MGREFYFIMIRYALVTLALFVAFTSCTNHFSHSDSGEHYLLVGTYTSAGSHGIYVCKFNRDGSFSIIDSAKAEDPSYLTISDDKKFVYAVNEVNGKEGAVQAFSFDSKNGKLTELNRLPSAGIAPCYVSIDISGKWVFAGNYVSGTASMYSVDENGALKTRTDVVTHQGKGPDSTRQEGPHVHATVLSRDEKFLFVPDLGIDKVMTYQVDTKNGKLIPANPPFSESQAGSGPRHLTFDPEGKHAYLVEELKGEVAVFDYDGNGKLTQIQEISTVPQGYSGPIGSADIHVSPDGKFLYASNRGQSNTLAIFSIEKNSGKLTLVGHQSTLGSIPRNFSFDPSGEYILVANQESNDIVIFKVDHATGKLTPLEGRIKISKPVCLKFVE